MHASAFTSCSTALYSLTAATMLTLICQNILGSAVTSVSPLAPVCVCVCGNAIKGRCRTQTVIAWSGGNGSVLAQLLGVGGQKGSWSSQHSDACIIDNLCFLSLDPPTVIYFSWLVQEMVVCWAVSRQLGWKMVRQSISLARIMWRGGKAKAAFTLCFISVLHLFFLTEK